MVDTQNSRCPSCKVSMTLQKFPGQYGQTVAIDACQNCSMLWFDKGESAKLAPDGVVELFQMISAKSGQNQFSHLSDRLGCTRCGLKLLPVTDKVITGAFNYFACEADHGRLISFYQFLIEKRFVRLLQPAEISRLAIDVKQIKCSSCGAPVDLVKQSACGYCRSPIAVFDRDAAKNAIDHYLAQRKKQLPAAPQTQGTISTYEGEHSRYSKGEIAGDILWALAQFAGNAGRSSSGSRVATTHPRMESNFPTPSLPVISMPSAENLPGEDAMGEMSTLFNNSELPIPETSALPDLADFSRLADSVDLSSVADGTSDLVDLVGDGIGALLGSLFD
jgi:Zn-finger nucleic acid-binding protein/DNA-directed RNA polymerase subunit RPC12/RpoP